MERGLSFGRPKALQRKEDWIPEREKGVGQKRGETDVQEVSVKEGRKESMRSTARDRRAPDFRARRPPTRCFKQSCREGDGGQQKRRSREGNGPIQKNGRERMAGSYHAIRAYIKRFRGGKGKTLGGTIGRRVRG